MFMSNDIAAPGKWTATSSGSGYTGPYLYMSREVLLSEVGTAGGESLLSLEIDPGGLMDYRFSFLYYPEITPVSGAVTILEIDDIVSLSQSNFTAPGAFWIETPDGRKRSPDYSLAVGDWNYFEIAFHSDGSFVLLVNGRCMGSRETAARKHDEKIKLSMGCGRCPARAMWDGLRFCILPEQDIRLAAHTLQGHGYFQSVVYENPDMHMLFDGRCVRGEDLYTQADWQYPGFQKGSALYGKPMTDMDELSCFGVRWHGNCYKSPHTNRIELHCHQDYELEVHSTAGNVIAFSTTSTTQFNPLRCTATYYLFSAIPGVILCSCRVENTFSEPQPDLENATITYMMFTQGEHDSHGMKHIPAYDGFRLWPAAGEDLSYFYGADARVPCLKKEEIIPGDGVFLKWLRNKENYYGVWFTGDSCSLSRGLAVMQKGGSNDWAVNPPVGNIFAGDRHFGTFTSCGDEYVSLATGVRLPGDLSMPGSVSENEMVFFALKPECPVNTEELLFNMERSFNLPPAICIDPICTGKQPVVYICETDGLYREWQIVSLPWVYGNMAFNPDIRDVFPGNAYAGRMPVNTVLLLNRVKPFDKIKLGRLPVTLRATNQSQWTVESALSGMLRSVWIHIEAEYPALRSIDVDRGIVNAWRVSGGRVEICMDLEPGVTTIKCGQ